MQRVVYVFDIDVALITPYVESTSCLWLKINHSVVFGNRINSINLLDASWGKPDVNISARLLPWDPNVATLIALIIVIAFII